ncbi:DUF2242 domain-containing protein [Pseudomonas chlororaphis]|uniref:DUF2242 domain-containing protein n=1 Tax=Pseudomonas chlororaphis TaxID=587753 RepID=UPI0006A5E7D8|nr:DUF2242 domain-containing protein [Pseudomonas chlororaphis]AZD03297.1 putative lipoprotein [Pseudomonas chlororaphis subsp. chlororaphis]MBM0282571.1 DUF2242 domain-containing protein [Pseudomonas chlororaphis]MDO1506795.1 DUF2242 domain-containing protein [Pseudomonas chlororaphis]ORM46045.1 hypothetical protein B6D51_22810 [Pseudomonas chlororaphis subsp. chlororaphis]TWR91565.1 DUF2242 domain-containing protein [Pseudomonas chlororaphis subsp. chlororaphis]
MHRSFHLRAAGLTLLLAAVAGCSSQKTAIYEHENFDDSGTFSRNYPVNETASCEAARRALLSQGYIITSSDPKLVSGHKSFQQTGETHMEISFSVVCAQDGNSGHRSTVFANALQDRYALKKVNNSASLGVGVLGSVSMPIGSTDDSMVKVASETVSSAKFYERYFALVELFLPQEAKKAAHIIEKPKTDLGVPEPKPAEPAAAPAPAPVTPQPAPVAPAAEPAPATPPVVPAESNLSQPLAPPAEAAPIAPGAPAEPTPSTEIVTPPPASTLPAPTEPIPALPQ